jgi:hypothetical protein
LSKFVFDGVEHARKRREEQRQAEREAFAGLVLESLDHPAVQERLRKFMTCRGGWTTAAKPPRLRRLVYCPNVVQFCLIGGARVGVPLRPVVTALPVANRLGRFVVPPRIQYVSRVLLVRVLPSGNAVATELRCGKVFWLRRFHSKIGPGDRPWWGVKVLA